MVAGYEPGTEIGKIAEIAGLWFGFELAFLLPPAAWLHKRRRRGG
jgi:hypothetical protein